MRMQWLRAVGHFQFTGPHFDRTYVGGGGDTSGATGGGGGGGGGSAEGRPVTETEARSPPAPAPTLPFAPTLTAWIPIGDGTVTERHIYSSPVNVIQTLHTSPFRHE